MRLRLAPQSTGAFGSEGGKPSSVGWSAGGAVGLPGFLTRSAAAGPARNRRPRAARLRLRGGDNMKTALERCGRRRRGRLRFLAPIERLAGGKRAVASVLRRPGLVVARRGRALPGGER